MGNWTAYAGTAGAVFELVAGRAGVGWDGARLPSSTDLPGRRVAIACAWDKTRIEQSEAL